MKHALNLPAAEFRQALNAALLYTSNDDARCANICLHYQRGEPYATINALDGDGFYQQIINCNMAEADKKWSLPAGSGAFSNIGQLLIPQDAAKAMLKLIPKSAKGDLTLEVTFKPGSAPGSAAYHTVNCSYGDNVCYSFQAVIDAFTDYNPLFDRALEAKNATNIIQGRAFLVKEFARIGKALAPGSIFRTYWPKDRSGICLLECGENVRILYMAGRWEAAA